MHLNTTKEAKRTEHLHCDLYLSSQNSSRQLVFSC